jgi:acetyl esterase/lipase
VKSCLVAALLTCVCLAAGCAATASGTPAPPESTIPVAPAAPSGESSNAVPTPDSPPGNAARSFDAIAYASVSPSQRLDLRLPPTGDGPFPLVVFIHGGAWERGDRALFPGSLAMPLVAAGFAVASVDYRYSQEAVFPAQIQDVEAAIRFLRAQVSTYHLDGKHIGVWGESAGGHLAVLAGTASDVAAFNDPLLGNADMSARVSAVVDWYGPSDLSTFDAQLAADGCTKRIAAATSAESRLIGASVEAQPDEARAASPVTYVTADDPDILIQHGRADCVVPWQQSDELAHTYAQVAGTSRVSVDLLDQAGHGGAHFVDPVNMSRVVAFFSARLRAAS